MKFIRFVFDEKEKSGILNKGNIIYELNNDYINYNTDFT